MNAFKTLRDSTPRVWFSEDKGFGSQAFRLGAAYFTPRPITQDKIVQALNRCGV
ncbi:MAG TPA: hypothetical protein VJY54_08900 [Lachnospiraceae bacterium]|nr:hypothetical protein [Lachnospiraceae bacterium]